MTPLLLALGAGLAAGQPALPDAFTARLRRYRLHFTRPGPCFAPVPVEPSDRMPYQFALRCDEADLEVRYAIHEAASTSARKAFTMRFLEVAQDPSPRIIPFEPGMKIPEDAVAVTGTVQPGTQSNLPPGSRYVRGFVDPAFEPFQPMRDEDVRRFRAEWGAVSVAFVPRPDVSTRYRRGMMLMLRVEGRADALVHFLFNGTGERTRQAMAEAFGTLKFD
ncbi:MAG: hypothetical protein KIT17_12580 [Rubrivivax sp.]|nr:hypothetical protein [Rubrivivax sp.]